MQSTAKPESKDVDKYQQTFILSLEKYRSHEERPGYPMGWFSRFRHKFDLYPALKTFQEELMSSKSEEESKRIITQWLKNPLLKSNDHSFRSYLVDELQIRFPSDRWQSFSNHPLIFFTGMVYRGTNLPPELVFEDGLKNVHEVNSIRSYSDVMGSGNIGISTSHDSKIAYAYAGMVYGRGVSYKLSAGYTYKIDLSRTPTPGIDLFKMGGLNKMEVNIPGDIPASAIVGMVNKNGAIIERNKNYILEDKKTETTDVTPDVIPNVLNNIFKHGK